MPFAAAKGDTRDTHGGGLRALSTQKKKVKWLTPDQPRWLFPVDRGEVQLRSLPLRQVRYVGLCCLPVDDLTDCQTS